MHAARNQTPCKTNFWEIAPFPADQIHYSCFLENGASNIWCFYAYIYGAFTKVLLKKQTFMHARLLFYIDFYACYFLMSAVFMLEAVYKPQACFITWDTNTNLALSTHRPHLCPHLFRHVVTVGKIVFSKLSCSLRYAMQGDRATYHGAICLVVTETATGKTVGFL